MTFNTMSDKQHKIVSAKGGSKKVPKGLALVSPEKREQIRAKALATRRKNRG